MSHTDKSDLKQWIFFIWLVSTCLQRIAFDAPAPEVFEHLACRGHLISVSAAGMDESQVLYDLTSDDPRPEETAEPKYYSPLNIIIILLEVY